MVASSDSPGITERWFARAARTRGIALGAPSGALGLALIGLISAIGVAMSFTLDVRIGAVVFTLGTALAGGIASARAVWPEVSASRRAWVLALNLVSEGLIVVAAALWARGAHQDLPGPLAAGFLALSGGLMLAYARTRILASAGMDLADGPWGIAARDVRLLILAVGIAIGQPYWALVVIAVLAHGAVLGHLARLRVTLRG